MYLAKLVLFQWPRNIMYVGMDTFHDTERVTERRSVVTSVATCRPGTNQVHSEAAFQPRGKEINETAHDMTGGTKLNLVRNSNKF